MYYHYFKFKLSINLLHMTLPNLQLYYRNHFYAAGMLKICTIIQYIFNMGELRN